MQVKVFEAEDMRSALEKVKQDLGPEALILSTRTVNKSKLGFPAKTRIEVTAAVDADGKGAAEVRGQGSRQAPGQRRGPEFPEAADPAAETPGRAGFAAYLDQTRQEAAKESRKGAHEDILYEELRQMRRSFQGLARELAQVKGTWPGGWQQAAEGGGGWPAGPGDAQSELLSQLDGLGISREVMQVFAGLLARGAVSDELPAGGGDPETVLQHLVAASVALRNPLAGPFERQRRLAFVGPTGVGKTTTVAKLAAAHMLAGGGKTVLATIDNYRIAAVEQLKIYGQIMNMPVEVARRPAELDEILARHSDADLVLVDTAGRSPRDEMRQQELAAFLSGDRDVESYLLLSAATRESDQYGIIERFGHLNLSGLVLTKLDECDGLGQIVNLGVCGGYPICFLTNGQKVPEDLLVPDPRQIAKMILNRDEGMEQWSIRETGTRQERFVH
jgi:flagellar biosynthesis protein FlhF